MRVFVKDGPEIPDHLLQAHEEGRLVFFCGAGISYYTGLPGFEDLTKKTMGACGLPFDRRESNPLDVAVKNKKFDKALHLLEDAASEAMRPRVIEILSRPPKRAARDLKIHKALLSLAAVKDGGYRLVTTNFDDRFERANPSLVDWQAGPRLCPPRPESWRDLTYLHGKIDKRDPQGKHLVLTSADFGRAYLQDGWAARFVVELFREFSVLFIGYSLNDPIVGYLVDALAADRKLKDRFKESFVLSNYNGTDVDKEQKTKEWIAKGVTPILFRSKKGKDNFYFLNETLIRWGREYAGGVGSRIELALRIGATPYVPGADDADNLIWALSQKDGGVARAFANADDPIPHISWLRAQSKTATLEQKPSNKIQNQAPRRFEDLLDLPSPGESSAPLAGPVVANLPLSLVTEQLGQWLAKHLDKRELVEWVIERGGSIHPKWAGLLEQNLEKVSPPYASFWRLVLDPAIHQSNFSAWPAGVSEGVWPKNGDRDFLRAARPYLQIRQSFWRDETAPPQKLSDLAQFEVLPTAPDYLMEVWSNRSHSEIRAALVRNADALTGLLSKGMRLERRFNGLSYLRFGSYSLTEPGELGQENIWVLVCLCVVAFDAAREDHPALAKALAWRWLALAQVEKLDLFPRMALHALAYIQPIPVDEELALLLDEDAPLLWDSDVADELELYISQRAPSLPPEARDRLVAAIANGPTQRACQESGWDDKFAEQQKAWRLVMLADAGVPLPAPFAQMAEKNRRENVEEIKVEGFIESYQLVRARYIHLSDEQIANLLCKDDEDENIFRLWSDLCVSHVDRVLRILPYLTEHCPDSSPLWDRLIRLGEVKEAAQRFAILQGLDEVFSNRPDRFGRLRALSISRILRAFAPSVPAEGAERIAFLTLWQATWNAALTDENLVFLDHQEDLAAAINAPGGILAEAILDLALREENQIPTDIMPLLDRMATGETLSYRYSRIILASRLVYLHRRAAAWAKQHLINRMDTESKDPESIPMWEGFTWASRITIPLMVDLHDAFLSVAGRLEAQKGGKVWNQMFIETLIEDPERFTANEIGRVMKNATGTDLGDMAWQLARRLDRAADKAPVQWQNTIRPIIEQCWPSTTAQRTSTSVDKLIQLAVAAKSAFPDAIDLMLKHKLIGSTKGPLPKLFSLSRQSETGINPCKDYPKTVLSILEAVVKEDAAPSEGFSIRQILDRLIEEHPALAEDHLTRRLHLRLPQ